MAITVENRTQVAQLYTALFGRAPELDGFNYWLGRLGDGATFAQVADIMYATDPARAYYPSFLTHQEIIARFYVNVLGRSADAEGLAFWTAKLDAVGATPGAVIAQMISVVAGYTGSDPAGLLSQDLFVNKVTVAQHYAESGGTLAGAAAILQGVTADPATVTAAIAAIDSGAPAFSSAVVNGTTLTLTYVDAGPLDAAHPPSASAFTVMVDGVARAVSGVAVDAAAKTVALTLAIGVTSTQSVTISYTDPTANDDAAAVQDAAGTDAASLAATAVSNATPAGADVSAPVFAGATVSGDQLVMTYTDAATLDSAHPPPVSAFAVTVEGSARAVSSVAVDAAAMTVTLTLAAPILGGQSVTVAYTDPTGGNDAGAIQDATGNDAASLAATSITGAGSDVTGPHLLGATVNGDTLAMSFDESLDAGNAPLASAFTVKVEGTSRTVLAVDVDPAFDRVILTLATPVGEGEAVTVAYKDPTLSNDTLAIQDLLGNDAGNVATTDVTNETADVTAPVFDGASVNGKTLVMTYVEANTLDSVNIPATGAFDVTVNGLARAVNSVAVNAANNTVTLTLSSAVTAGQTVTVAYTDPTSRNNTAAIQDAAGNDAATLGATAVANVTGDTTPPVFASAEVNGKTLVMTYTDLNFLDSSHKPSAGAFAVKVDGASRSVGSVGVDPDGTVTLTLSSAVTNGQTVTVAYTDPTSGNDASAIQDANGNDAATLPATAVTNNTPAPDTTAPVFVSATVNGTSLVLVYSDANLLDAAHLPLKGAFEVMAGGSAVTVNDVAIDGDAMTVALTLATAVASGDSVTVAYNDPTPGDDSKAIQDLAGNDAASLSATAVTNSTPVALIGDPGVSWGAAVFGLF